MPVQLIQFPFTIANNGYVATQLDNTPDYYTSELTVLLGTRPGERELVPSYGVEDLAYDPFPVTTLRAQIEKFGPPVSINDVVMVQTTEKQMNITVSYEPVNSETPDADYLVGA